MCPCSQPLRPLNMASLHHKHYVTNTHTRVVLLLSWHNTVDDHHHHQATCLWGGFNRIIISFLVCVLFFYFCVYVYISQLSQAPPFLLLSIYSPAIHLHSPCPTLPITSGHYTKQVTEGGRKRCSWQWDYFEMLHRLPPQQGTTLLEGGGARDPTFGWLLFVVKCCAPSCTLDMLPAQPCLGAALFRLQSCLSAHSRLMLARTRVPTHIYILTRTPRERDERRDGHMRHGVGRRFMESHNVRCVCMCACVSWSKQSYDCIVSIYVNLKTIHRRANKKKKKER